MRRRRRKRRRRRGKGADAVNEQEVCLLTVDTCLKIGKHNNRSGKTTTGHSRPSIRHIRQRILYCHIYHATVHQLPKQAPLTPPPSVSISKQAPGCRKSS